MTIKDVDIRRMERETNIAAVAIETAFERVDQSSDNAVAILRLGFDDALRLYKYGHIPMGSNREMAVVRKIAEFFSKKVPTATPVAS